MFFFQELYLAAVTLRDVAASSGVSVATVSLVLNGKGNISPAVRTRVLDSAQKIGYVKNIHASAMASRRSSHVAVLVDESYEKAFEWHLIRSILIPLEASLSTQQYYPILIPVTRSQTTDQIVEKVLLSGAGAMFAIHFGEKDLFQRLEDRGIAVMLLNHDRGEHSFHSVTDDFVNGTLRATNHLLEQGHRDLIYIDYARPDLPGVEFDRRIGFLKAAQESAYQVRYEDYTIPGLRSISEIETLIETLTRAHRDDHLSIVCHDDYLAAQVYAVLVTKKIDVPEHASIIAPGDTLDYSLPFIPQITTYRTDFELMGTLAGQVMLRRFDGTGRVAESLKVQQVLQERGSVKQIHQ